MSLNSTGIPIWTYLARHIAEDLRHGRLNEEVAAAVLEWEFRDRVREAITEHREIALILMQAVEELRQSRGRVRAGIMNFNSLSDILGDNPKWWELGPKAKRLLVSLLKACFIHDETWGRKVKEIALGMYKQEHGRGMDGGVRLGLAFAGFHAAGGPVDEDLVPVLDWVQSDREQFDSLCRGLYGKTPLEAEANIRTRLGSDERATALYLFNLREPMEQQGKYAEFRQLLQEQVNLKPWPSVKRAVEYLSKELDDASLGIQQ